MDANTITYGGNLAPRVSVFAVAMMLVQAAPELVAGQFATRQSLAGNSGDTVKWRRVEPWAPSEAALVEGVQPTKMPLTIRDYTAVMAEYGAWAELTSKVTELHPDNILGELVKLCGRNAGETFEKLTLNFLKAGTTVMYAGTSATTRATVSAPIQRYHIDLATRIFRNNDVRPLKEIIAPTTKVGTKGVPEAYFALCAPDVEADVRHLTGFKETVEYGNPNAPVPAEFGNVQNVRFVYTRHLTSWQLAATSSAGTTYLSAGVKPSSSAYPDVYPILILGKDAFGIVDLKKKANLGVLVAQPGVPRPPLDAMGRMGSVAWRGWFAGCILNQYAVIRIECLATAQPSW